MSYTNILTSKGQVTIPKEFRDAIGLKPGAAARFELLDARTITITAPLTSQGVRDLIGKPSKKQPLTTKEKQRLQARGIRSEKNTS